MLGDDHHPGVGPWRTTSGGNGTPCPQVEMYPTQYGDVTQVVIPVTVYETVQALGYHHLADLYTADHWIKGEGALKEQAPARKGIPGPKARVARRSAVLAHLQQVPPPRWQAAPKDRIPSAVPAYPEEAVIGGWVAKTTRVETVNHSGYAIKVTLTMKDTVEAKDWAPELRVCYQPRILCQAIPGCIDFWWPFWVFKYKSTRLYMYALRTALLNEYVHVAFFWGPFCPFFRTRLSVCRAHFAKN